ncbi:MAG TPA: hypothetical protein VMM77_06205, partial [Gemmatimonadaceae bacterium]|nr:hypothetical protein [Gemmatimonadaceae bacterium]
MGSPAQSLLASPPGPNRRGVALLSGILALVAVGVLVAGVFVISDLDAKSVKNREASSRAMHITEAGVAHALGVLRSQFKATPMTQLIRGADWTWGTADDGLLVGYSGLTSADEIPAAGRAFDGGTYFVKLKDDPADADGDGTADSNNRLLLECRGVTADGATA